MSTTPKRIRAGLESLTITRPSAVLEEAYQDALRAVAARPSRREREASICLLLQATDANEIWNAAKKAVRG